MTTIGAHLRAPSNRSQRFSGGNEGTNENMSPDFPETVSGADRTDGETQRPTGDDEDLERFVLFTVGEHRLAVPVDAIKNTTSVPTDITTVPRSPAVVEGVTDLRGEVTAVIDPRMYFPTDTEPSKFQQLLVLDRPDDDQPAALRVDTVQQVESVPESDVLSGEDVDDADLRELAIPENALEHPLLSAIVRKEERVDVDADDVLPTDDDSLSLETSLESSNRESSDDSPLDRLRSGQDHEVAEDVFGDDLFDEDDGGRTSGESEEGTVEVEATPLLDVERLLLAAGHMERAASSMASPTT